MRVLFTIALAASTLAVAQPDRDARFESLLAEAHEAQARSDFRGAAASYRQAVAIRPDIAELWSNLGLMQHQSGDYSQAAEAFRTALRLNQALFVPNLFLGLDLMQLNRPRRGDCRTCSAAGKLNPHDPQPALALGRALPCAVGTREVREMVSAGSRAGPAQWRGVVRPGARVFWFGGSGRSEADRFVSRLRIRRRADGQRACRAGASDRSHPCLPRPPGVERASTPVLTQFLRFRPAPARQRGGSSTGVSARPGIVPRGARGDGSSSRSKAASAKRD